MENKKSNQKTIDHSKNWVIIFALALFIGLLSYTMVMSQSVNTYKYKNGDLQGIESYDAIIVPGVPFVDGNWSQIMKARVYWAVYMYQNDITEHIIFSGSAVYSPYIEAEIMALYAIELGVSPQDILIENNAEHSTENMYYSKKLAEQFKLERIALATDPFQSAMLKPFNKKLEFGIDHIPIDFKTIEKIAENDPEIDFTKAYVENFVSLVERESFFERFKGTQGKRVLEEMEQTR